MLGAAPIPVGRLTAIAVPPWWAPARNCWLRDGDRVTCQPFAGSAPRAVDPELDAATGAASALRPRTATNTTWSSTP